VHRGALVVDGYEVAAFAEGAARAAVDRQLAGLLCATVTTVLTCDDVERMAP
jgi:hypothetical protein